jgi:hypothetical protein
LPRCNCWSSGCSSRALFALNLVAYTVLCVLNALRARAPSQRFFGDLFDHLRGPGFFTSVAATSILGSQFLLLTDDSVPLALLLWGLALLLWVALTYTIFTGLTIKQNKPPLDKGINGAWLLAVVATQSIAVLSALLAAPGPAGAAGAELPGAVDVAVGRHALHLDDVADLLPLHLLHAGAGRPVAALLDQYGGDGDLDPGRLAAHPQLARRAVPAVAAALHQGVHGVLLGHRHLVDPDAAGAGDLAPCLPALSAALRPALLGRGVPARHVRGLHRTHDRGDGLRVPNPSRAW